MKVHYFYLSQGVTRGPLSKEEVDQLIRVRQLHGMDLVLKETSKGIEDWTALQEMEEFKDAFKNLVDDKEALDWVVLVKRGKGQYLQNGPFSTKDVRAHLSEGRLRYTDYAWKSGMTKWVLISELAEFKSKKKTPKIDKIDPLERADKTLPDIPKISFAKQNTVEFNRNPYLADAGKEVNLIEIELDPEDEEQVELPEVIHEEKAENVDESYLRPFIFEAKKKNQWMVLASVGLVVFLIAVLYQVNKGPQSKVAEKPKPVQEKAVVLPPKSEIEEVVEVPVVEEKEEAIKEEKKAPTQLNVIVDKERLNISSDGSRHYPLRVLIVGLPGQIQEGRLWFKSLVLRPENGTALVSLLNLNLVPGAYRVRVTTSNDLKNEKEFFYEMEGKDFIGLRNRNRKEQSYWYQMDRIRLISRLSKLKDTLRSYSVQRPVKMGHLKEKEKSTEKVFFFEWEKYIELKNRAVRLPQQNRAQVQKELDALRQETELLSQRLGLLSVWR